MNENEFHIDQECIATLVSIVSPSFPDHETIEETNNSLKEMKELLKTLDIKFCEETHVQNKSKVEAATILGKGRLEEIARIANKNDSTLLVFDFELSASQLRNIKELTGIPVVDRVHIILEIFAIHARTREAKIQIEMARLQYILPRLSGFWSHLGRQRSAKGSIGGEGEQQIELDRRLIRNRIEFYKNELVQIEKSRKEQQKRRRKKTITAALVGYTNAGKSSIMNRLCKEDILEEDKLFATLDSTFRLLSPNTRPPMLLIDTVGFISNLPNTLIKGFKTTLDSAQEADLLIIVCDVSDPNYKKQLQVTTEVLNELEIGKKEKIIIFNKKDKLKNSFEDKIAKRTHVNSFVVSSFDKEDMDNLRDWIINYFLEKQESYDLFVPYELGNIHSLVNSQTNIRVNKPHDHGIYYKVKSPKFLFEQLHELKDYLLSPEKSKELFG